MDSDCFIVAQRREQKIKGMTDRERERERERETETERERES